MTPGNGFDSVPPQRGAGSPRREPAEVRYEYKTVQIRSHWSRRRQDREINTLAAQGWELTQRSPRGGLLGGGSDNATFRRRAQPGQQLEATGLERLLAWWRRQSTAQRWVWASIAAVLLVAVVVNEVAST